MEIDNSNQEDTYCENQPSQQHNLPQANPLKKEDAPGPSSLIPQSDEEKKTSQRALKKKPRTLKQKLANMNKQK